MTEPSTGPCAAEAVLAGSSVPVMWVTSGPHRCEQPCPSPGECRPSCSPDCFKAKMRSLQFAFTVLKKARA